MRREGELAIRAALGASAGALRRTLLAESLLLCGAGAALGVLIAWPMVAVLARYAARFSVRALDLTVDASLLWVGVGLALVAAVLLAFVPRLPSADASNGFGLSNGSVRITSGTNRRLRLFAVTQIAASFVLLAGAGMLLTTLFALQRAQTGMNTRNVLALNVPVNYERPRAADASALQGSDPAHQRAARRRAGRGRHAGAVARGRRVLRRAVHGRGLRQGRRRRGSARRGSARCRPASSPRSACRSSPAATSTPPIASDSEKVVIVSQSLAQRLFPESGRGESPVASGPIRS